MARYAIGDIQGCYKQFMEILDLIDFNPSHDVLYLVGDLVNRGPQSLEVLKWVYKNQDSVINVLGNHDIYLLARYNHLVKPDDEDTLGDVIRDKNIHKYINWLRSCPLIYHDNQIILVHAGVYPRMDFNDLLHINHSISNHLKAADYPQFIESILGLVIGPINSA
jgi:bis(5'-nucleosyl)-tetraphosphatase (symmetrical)